MTLTDRLIYALVIAGFALAGLGMLASNGWLVVAGFVVAAPLAWTVAKMSDRLSPRRAR